MDPLGRQVEDFNGPVTISLGPNSPPGTLSGTLTVNVGNGFSLVASANSLPSVRHIAGGMEQVTVITLVNPSDIRTGDWLHLALPV